jgi:flagellar motility protein MotE (MotC chaperone)
MKKKNNTRQATTGNAINRNNQTGRRPAPYPAIDPADISPDPISETREIQGPAPKPKKRIGLELLILLALCLKLLGTAGFVLFHESDTTAVPTPSVLAVSEAHAQDETTTAPAMLPQDASLTQQYQKMIQDLQIREEAVKKQEERLNEREKALDILEKKINERLAEIEATREKLSMLVKRHDELVEQQKVLKDARIEHLVAAYKSMRPEAAGNLVNNLEDDVAVEILSAMPGRSAGQILANVNPEKAARLTKAISEKKPPAPTKKISTKPQQRQ